MPDYYDTESFLKIVNAKVAEDQQECQAAAKHLGLQYNEAALAGRRAGYFRGYATAYEEVSRQMIAIMDKKDSEIKLLKDALSNADNSAELEHND